MEQKNVVGWFEIPVSDMDRALKFYEAVFGHKLERSTVSGADMAMFPCDMEGYGAGGSLIYYKEAIPSPEGVIIYFAAPEGDIELGLKKATEAGGKSVMEKMSIGEHGFIAFFSDTEGNKIGIHSMK